MQDTLQPGETLRQERQPQLSLSPEVKFSLSSRVQDSLFVLLSAALNLGAAIIKREIFGVPSVSRYLQSVCAVYLYSCKFLYVET